MKSIKNIVMLSLLFGGMTVSEGFSWSSTKNDETKEALGQRTKGIFSFFGKKKSGTDTASTSTAATTTASSNSKEEGYSLDEILNSYNKYDYFGGNTVTRGYVTTLTSIIKAEMTSLDNDKVLSFARGVVEKVLNPSFSKKMSLDQEEIYNGRYLRVVIPTVAKINDEEVVNRDLPSSAHGIALISAMRLVEIIKKLWKQYGIAYKDEDINVSKTLQDAICKNNNKVIEDIGNKGLKSYVKNPTLGDKLLEFYAIHPRKYVTINPIVKMKEHHVFDNLLKSYFFTYERTAVKGEGYIIYVILNAQEGFIGSNNRDRGSACGDISFVIKSKRDNEELKNLSYRLYRRDGETITDTILNEGYSKFVSFAGYNTGLTEDHFKLIYRIGLLNNLQGDAHGNGFGSRIYKARHMEYFGMLNTTIGDAMFEKAAQSKTHTSPNYFYHSALKDGSHIVAFYTEKNRFVDHIKMKGGLRKKDNLKEHDPTAVENPNSTTGKGYEPVAQDSEVSYSFEWEKSEGRFTPFKVYKSGKGDAISFGQHKRDTSVLYLMKISDKKFKEAILPQLQKAGIAK